MVDKLTGDIADTSNRAHALEKRVSDGTKTTICQSGRKRSFHHDGALPGFWDFPADGSQVGGAPRGGRNEGFGGTQPGTEIRHLPDDR